MRAGRLRYFFGGIGFCCLWGCAVCPALADSYTPGFVWNRSADWVPGTVNDATAGNPNNDSKGNPTWYYEQSQGGSLSSANPWYSQPRSSLVWSADTQQWRAGTQDQDPSVAQTAMEQADINFTFASPVVRWQNPTGQSILANIDFGTDVVSGRVGSGSYNLELAVVEYRALTNSYDVLWTDSRTAPWNRQVQPGPSVDLPDVSIGAGDSILFTMRIAIDQPLSGNGSAAWIDGAQLTLEPSTAAAPLPRAAYAGITLLVGIALARVRNHIGRRLTPAVHG